MAELVALNQTAPCLNAFLVQSSQTSPEPTAGLWHRTRPRRPGESAASDQATTFDSKELLLLQLQGLTHVAEVAVCYGVCCNDHALF